MKTFSLGADIQDKDNQVEGIMASKQKMEKLLSNLGANSETNIIIYDAKGNPDADAAHECLL